uniref:Phage tail protein n=1 Tax=Caudovirales sp. ctkvU4 TaxID=2826783 RepID=A0A8S5QQW5_9CAUD|nr:MAG TPA: hypothetical protein [Caudovirales sp. ctkvU4]
MARIGSMGGIRFTVSSFKTLTLDEFSREGAPRLATHELIGNKAVTEFLAPGVDTISFKIRLRAENGINPYKELQKLRKMKEEGQVFPVFIGYHPLSQHKWMIKSMGEAVPFWTMHGAMQSITVDISLQEYVVRFQGALEQEGVVLHGT